MKYSATIRLQYDDKLYKCLIPEIHERDRASLKLDKVNDELIIGIDAKDAVALRALMNSLTQMLTIYDSTGDKNG